MPPADDLGQDFDLAAAGLRADGSELRISVEVLAAKLEESLPGRTRVQRHGGLLHRGGERVRQLQVDLGGATYQLDVDRERVQCSREREVGGISIKRETLDPQAWVTALARELHVEAERNAEARQALEKVLG